MRIRWDGDPPTGVLVEMMAQTIRIPCDPLLPDWQNLKSKIDAGELVPDPYVPPFHEPKQIDFPEPRP